MAKIADLTIRFLSDISQATAGFDSVGKKIGKFAAGLKIAGGTALAAGAAVKVGYDKMIKPAGELEQSVGAIDSVFKGHSKQIHTWAKGAATDVGLTRNEYNELGTLIGSQLKNGGTAMDKLAPKTNALIKQGADLSAMFGGTTADAVSALSSALKGERDPIEKYGVSLKQSSIDAEAARLGYKKVGGALSDQANQAATLSLITKQTKDAQGTFAKESETLAGKQQRLTAQYENAKATIGTALLPIATKFFGFLADKALPAITKLIDGFSGAGDMGDFGSKLGLEKLQPILSAVAGYFQKVAPVVKEFVTGALIPLGQTIATKVAPILQKIITTVLPVLAAAWAKLIPVVGEVVSALGPLIAAIADRLMPIISRLLPVVTTVFTAIVNVVKPVLSTLAAIIRTVTAIIKGDWSAAWDGIKAMFSAVWDFIKALVTNAIGTIKTVLSAAWTVIKAAAGAAWNGIKALIAGVWDGIKSLAGSATSWLIGKLAGAWTAIKGAASSAWKAIKGTISTAVDNIKTAVAQRIQAVIQTFRDLPGQILSAVSGFGSLLLSAGRSLISGLVSGITEKISSVRDTLTGLTEKITSWKGPIRKDKRLLEPAGVAIMGGLIRSIEAERATLRRTLASVTKDVAGTTMTSPDVLVGQVRRGSSPSTAIAARRAAGGTVVNITVNGAVDPLSTAKQIEDLLARRRFAYGGTA